jgi:hypothetical protein
MKLSLASKGPVSPTTARNCFLVNQFATPGLGSLMGRRWIAGTGQLALSVLGFILLVVWFFKIIIQYYGQITGDVPVQPVGWIGLTGGIIFVAAWFWSLVTSISLLMQAKKDEAQTFQQNVPPPLS